MAKQVEAVTRAGAPEELTRGHKKKARTRQQLLETALHLYAQPGCGDLSLNRLADEAGVSHGTVYNHFRTREDLLEAVGIALAEAFSHEVISLSVGMSSGAERLATGVRSFIRKARVDPEWGGALVRVVRYAEGFRTALAAYLRADLQAGQQQGDFHYANEDLAMAMVVAGTAGAIHVLLEGRDAEHHDSAAAEMVLRALGVPAQVAARIAAMPLPE